MVNFAITDDSEKNPSDATVAAGGCFFRGQAEDRQPGEFEWTCWQHQVISMEKKKCPVSVF